MLNKQHRRLYRQWMKGSLNLIVAAKKLGYKGGSLHKGIAKVKTLLSEMGIAVL